MPILPPRNRCSRTSPQPWRRWASARLALFGRLLMAVKQRNDSRALAATAGDDDMIFRHRDPVLVAVERLRNDDNAALGFPIIQGVRLVVHRITESVEIAPIGKCRGEAEAVAR